MDNTGRYTDDSGHWVTNAESCHNGIGPHQKTGRNHSCKVGVDAAIGKIFGDFSFSGDIIKKT